VRGVHEFMKNFLPRVCYSSVQHSVEQVGVIVKDREEFGQHPLLYSTQPHGRSGEAVLE